MNNIGYPLSPLGIAFISLFGLIFTYTFWPLYDYIGYITGTGMIGSIVVSVTVYGVVFVSVALEYN